jgi:hypothetical protein
VLDNVSQTLASPARLRPIASLRAVTTSLDVILCRPGTLGWPAVVFLACAAIAVVRLRREPLLWSVTAAPLACAVAGFAFWQQGCDTYWFLVLAPSAALVLGLALTAWPPVAVPAALVMVLLVAAAQPSRSTDSLSMHRLPEYGVLVSGSREIRRHLPEVRAVKTSFPLPGSTEPDYLYQLLGGRISPAATYQATIDRSGRVTFQAVAAGEGLNKGKD